MLDIIGTIGVLLVLAAYFLLQSGRMQSTQMAYPLLNFIGGWLIIVSLVGDWNFSAFLMEASWVLVSAYGMWKVWKDSKKVG